MRKSVLFSLFSILAIIAGVYAYQSQTQTLYRSNPQNQTVLDELTDRMESQVCTTYEDGSMVMISRDDSQAYLVRPEQTLGQAMAQGSLASMSMQQERGNCVRADPDYPPEEGEVACHCQDNNKNNCGDHRTGCARSCNSKLCKCCPGT